MTYTKLGKLKEGGFGKIFVVKDNSTGSLCAAKLLIKDMKRRIEEIYNDYRIVTELQHDAKLISGSARIINYKKIASHHDKPAIIMDLYKSFDVGQMSEYFRTNFDDCRTAHVINSIIQHITYLLAKLHDHGIAHRDIKQTNILANHISWLDKLKEKGKVSEELINSTLSKVSPENSMNDIIVILLDFGFSIDENTPASIYNNKVGTRAYESPELLKGRIMANNKIGTSTNENDPLHFSSSTDAVKFYQKCDVWALGVLLYKLINGKNIFNIIGTDSPENVFEKVKKFKKYPRIVGKNINIKNLNKKYKPIIMACLQFNAPIRLTAQEIFKKVLKLHFNQCRIN